MADFYANNAPQQQQQNEAKSASAGRAIAIERTATPIWSPATLRTPTPLLATGTVSGALDASFSSDSILELWEPFGSDDLVVDGAELQPHAALSVGSRFNRLAWGYVKDPERPMGVIAAGLENGEIGLWDPDLMLAGEDEADPLIARHELHKGPVRGLDFNTHQSNLLASGATNGEIYIWDLTTPNKPFSPGARSRSIDDITTLAWNSHVSHVLATGSNSGYTVVWDLKSKREVTALSYAPASATGVGANFGQPGWGAGGTRGVSCLQWHPDNPTKLVTSSDDDHNPVIMLWDLRNWKEPEKILTGHDKGILSLSWCTRDSDLLLSSGKDGRSICWNPSSGDIVAELPPSSNWAFDVQWCPRNPSVLTTASLSGKVSIHSIQNTSVPTASSSSTSEASLAPGVDGANLFNLAIEQNAANHPTKSLTQPPKWLRRPASAVFGFGGKLVSVDNKTVPNAPAVRVHSVVDVPDVVDKALRLDLATQGQDLARFCEERSKEISSGGREDAEVASWKLLGTLFRAGSKAELVSLLGFSKEDTRAKVNAVISAMGKQPSNVLSKTQSSGAVSGLATSSDAGDDSTSIAREPLVTFADTPTDGLSASSQGEGAAANARDGSEISVSVSGVSGAAKHTSDFESEVTEPSLFGDIDGATLGGTPSQSQAAADFYSQIGSGRPAALPDHVFGRGSDAIANSSVAATVGSASSVASLNLKQSTFKIYPQDESDVDRLLTKALVMGDFESAVDLALASDRFADAILLAVRGGHDLLAKTQAAYFERRTSALPYLRVFQSIVANDLSDVVQNADLSEWQEIFVVLCTFAGPEEFSALAEQLGQRLEYQYSVAKSSPSPESAPAYRKNAILCYLAAGQLEKVVGIWIQQMDEEEQVVKASQASSGVQLATVKYEAHAKALQTFIEKVTVFQYATGYVDADLAQPTSSAEVADSGARTYKLAALYERYVEYAELLANHGLVSVALRYVAQTPVDFQGRSGASGPAWTRDRLLRATGSRQIVDVFSGTTKIGSAPALQQQAQAPAPASYANTNQITPSKSNYNSYASNNPAYGSQPYQASPYNQQRPSYGQQNSHDDPYGPGPGVSNNYTPSQSSPYGQTGYQPAPPPSGYGANASAYKSPQMAQSSYQSPSNAYEPQSFVPAPPAIRESSPNFTRAPTGNAPPPPRAKPEQAWNDAPQIQRKQTPGGSAVPKPLAITSPFPYMPSAASAPGPPVGYGQAGHQVPPPPPSRGSNRTPAPVAPPPQAGRGFPTNNMPPPPPPSGGMGNQQQQQRFPQGGPPPPQGAPGTPRQPQQGQYPHLQQQGNFRGAPTPPPGAGQYGRAPAPMNGGPGPYAPPPGPQQHPQPGRPVGPPTNSGPYAPPPGPQRSGVPPPPFGAGGPPQVNPAPAAAPAPAPPKAVAPTSKYPPGDRSHIPPASKPIFDILSGEITRLRRTVPPQQAKMINDTEKRLNLLFDMLNCGTLSDATQSRVLEIVKAIEARNQHAALDLHLQMLTQGNAPDVSSFQAALKLVIQRMAT